MLSVHTLKPLDTEAFVAAAEETGGLLTIEEHTVNGGLGGTVAEALLENGTSPGILPSRWSSARFFFRRRKSRLLALALRNGPPSDHCQGARTGRRAS